MDKVSHNDHTSELLDKCFRSRKSKRVTQVNENAFK